MANKLFALVLTAAILDIGGCGVGTPQFQENPFDKVAGQQLIQSIVYNVTREVRDSIDYVYNNPDTPRKSTFLDTWGVNIALNLQIEEKTVVNPVVVGLPPSPSSAIFSVAASATASADATRQDKLNSYYTVKQLRALGPCDKKQRPGGVLLLQSDLGLTDWLNANVIAEKRNIILFSTDYADSFNKTNVLSHEIKFDITTSGTLTPSWKLTRALVNQSGNLFSATRDRTNDLTVTFGPTLNAPKPKLDKNGKIKRDALGNVLMTSVSGPSLPAAEAALASQIGLSVSNAIKGSLAQ